MELLKNHSQNDLSKKLRESNELIQSRLNIYYLLADIVNNNMASAKTILLYKKAVDEDDSIEGLDGFYSWIQEKYTKAFNSMYFLEEKLKQAELSSVISNQKKEFFMKKLILNKEYDFIGFVKEVTDNVLELLSKEYDAKKEYNNTNLEIFLQNKKHLDLDDNTKFDLLDLTAFLDLDIDEKFDYISKLKIALYEAKKIQIKKDIKDEENAILEYVNLLDEVQNKKIIGKTIYRNMLKNFNKLKFNEKQNAILDFTKEISVYENFWKKAKDSLDEESYKTLFSKKDTLNYKELENEFRKKIDLLEKKLTTDYNNLLVKSLNKGIISKKDYNKMLKKMNNSSLNNKKLLLDNFNLSIYKHKLLIQSIKKLENDEFKNILLSMYSTNTYSYEDIKNAFYKLKNRKNDDNYLDTINSEGLKIAIQRSVKNIRKKPKLKLISRLETFISAKSISKFDSKDFQKALIESRKKQNNQSASNIDITNNSVKNIDDINTDNKPLIKENFVEKDSKTEKNSVMLYIDDEDAVNSFNNSKMLDPNKDLLSIFVKDKDSSIRLKKTEIRTYIKHVKQNLNQ